MVSDDVVKNTHPAINHHLSNDPDFRRLARTEIRGGRIISTMCIGEDRRSGEHSGFETLVLNSASDLTLLDYEVHTDLFSAKKGHLEMVIKWFYGGMDEYRPALMIIKE